MGDDLYGITGSWIGRQALHAASLSLVHPRSGQQLTLTAQLPDDIVAACQQLGVDCSCAMRDGVGVGKREE